MSFGFRYSAVLGGLALLIGLVGSAVPAAIGRAVWIGVGVGYASQLAIIRVFAPRLFPESRMLAQGLGMVMRMVIVGLSAMLLLGFAVEFAASMLFALVAFFFVSTVMEPLFLRHEPLKRR
jgi:hypothetical protein